MFLCTYNKFFLLFCSFLFISFITLPQNQLFAQQSHKTQATIYEFDGQPYAFQKAHFDSATKAVMVKLGIQMHSFGTPYNKNDVTCNQVMSEDTNYKVLMLGAAKSGLRSDILDLTNRVMIESATGIPSYSTFISDFTATIPTMKYDYIIMQGHPYAWTTDAKQNEFKKIVEYLISYGVKFMTPYEYWQYKNDLSIPRVSAIIAILKLDDLRSTSSLFAPCFPAYDYLVSRKVKAGFGVNFMWGLTQSQIDTLNYYLRQTDSAGTKLFEIWNHGLDHSKSESGSSGSGGNWSDASIWPDSQVPDAADDVDIPSGSAVVIDKDAECNNLIINGTLTTSTTTPVTLTVHGNLVINSGASFTSPSLTGATANVVHTLVVYGNFTNNSGTFDFRQGSSGSTMRVLNTAFVGDDNTTIKVGTFSFSNNCFNGITVNKSNGAKVICASDVYMDQGASTCVSQLVLTNGIVETGNYSINCLSLNSADVVTPSATSYINGALGRGMSNSSPTAKLFPVGDAQGYRPVTIKSTTSGVASSHRAVVRCIHGDANTGSSTLTNGITGVSKTRYYSLSYNQGLNSGATSMSFNKFSPSYGLDDGVETGNTDIRVAYSTNNRATWVGMDQTTPHVAAPGETPTTINPDSLSSVLTLNSGTGFIYFTLAKASGIFTGVESSQNHPATFAVSQNYPNPFNPTTTIQYQIPVSANVILRVFNVMGEEVARLVDEVKPAGSYTLGFNASTLSSGVYYYQLKAGNFTKTMKMLLIK